MYKYDFAIFFQNIGCIIHKQTNPEAQLGGGRPGARPPLAPERGGRPAE